MFTFPPQASFNRPVPKSRIYDHAKPSKAIRARFVREVEEIIWSYKLAPETINLPSGADVREIQVFTVTLKTPELSEEVLRTIDEAIPSPLFFRLIHGNRIQGRVAYKRPSAASSKAWVVEDYFSGPWQSINTIFPPMPIALDLGQIYAKLLSPYLEPPARKGESLPEHLARLLEIRRLNREAADLGERLRKEKQFNRQVELNNQLRSIKQQLSNLEAS
jgi:hypothetical protein